MAEHATKLESANGLIKGYMLGSLGVGFVPAPFLDIALLLGVQLKMLNSLAKLYEVDFSEEFAKEVVTTCLSSATSVSLSVNLTQWLKLIPVYGWLIKGVSTAAFSGAFTYAVGKLFILHFESGCTFLTLDPQRVKDYFATQLEQGKVEVTKSFVGIKP